MEEKTKEPQNQSQYDNYNAQGSVELGVWTSHIWRTDPKHLLFLLARYKFCAKMLAGRQAVLEVGCGDAFGSPIVLQEVGRIHGIDFEPLVLNDAHARMEREEFGKINLSVHDITEAPMDEAFDAAYSLDVIEHVPPDLEGKFMVNICLSLKPGAVCIIGTPSADAASHASKASAEGHVNLKTAAGLRELLDSHFQNSMIFSMNDEVVHTGFYPMAHYILGLGIGPRAVR